MTAHDHRQFVEGCYRCDLNRDEIGIRPTRLTDEVREIISRIPRGKPNKLPPPRPGRAIIIKDE